MKKLMILSPIHAAVLLSVLFLASCGGDDDTPTDPGSDAEGGNPTAGGFRPLDSRLFGTWIWTGTETDSEVVAFTFREDGSGTFFQPVGREMVDRGWPADVGLSRDFRVHDQQRRTDLYGGWQWILPFGRSGWPWRCVHG